MKRTFTTFIFTLLTLSLFSQNHKNEYNIGLGVNIGFDNSGEIELIGEILKDKGKKFSNGYFISLGVVMPFENKRWGDNYDGIILEVSDDDLREYGVEKDIGAYLGFGYTIQRFSLVLKAGSYSDTYYENGFNSIMGLHHITRSSKEYFLYGGSLNIKVTKWISLTGGYNTYSGTNLGVNLRYTFQ